MVDVGPLTVTEIQIAMEEEMEDARMSDVHRHHHHLQHHRSDGVEHKERNDETGSQVATTPKHQKSNGQLQPSLSSQNTSAGVTGNGSEREESVSVSASTHRHRHSRLSHSDDHEEAHHIQQQSHEHQDKPIHHQKKNKQRVKSSGGFLLDSGSFSKSLKNASGFRIRSWGSDLKGKKKVIDAGNRLEIEKTRNGEINNADLNGELNNGKTQVEGDNSGTQIRAHGNQKSILPRDNSDERQEPADEDKATHQSPNQVAEHQHLRPPAIQINPTDIVNMALSLGESRRRQVSAGSYYLSTSPTPLVSTPPASSSARNFSPIGLNPTLLDNQHSFRDYSAGSKLRQNLQQQRRISRTASPELPRRPSGFRVSSMGQSADLTGSALQRPEDLINSNYQFSAATLARAEKARNYIELGAEFRRLLQLLPPLRKASNNLYPAVTNTDRNPITAAAVFARRSGELSRVSTNESGDVSPGRRRREYNPLQAIRNRRVRIRERQDLNPDIDSWNDVRKVRPWVEEVEDSLAYANSPYNNHKRSALPEYSFMDYELHHYNTNQSLSSPDKHSHINTVSKPRRQRMDWSVTPSELFADTYWLEQGNHKILIEDRNGNPIIPNRRHAENESRQQSKESRRDTGRDRSGFGDSRNGLVPSDISAKEGHENDSDFSERLSGGAKGGRGGDNQRHHRSRPILQSRFTRDRPLRRGRSSSVSSSEEGNLRRGIRKRSRPMPLSHLDNVGPLERHMIMMMREEEEEERRKQKAERKANERAEQSSTDSTDRGDNSQNALSHATSRQSAERNNGESVNGISGRQLSVPKKKRGNDLRLAHTNSNWNPISKIGSSSLSKNQQHGLLVSPSAADFGPTLPEDPSPVQVSRVRSLPIDQHNSTKSRLPKLPHLDILVKGSSHTSSHSRNEAGKLTSISAEKGYNGIQADSDASSLREHEVESDYGFGEKSPDKDKLKRVGSLKRDGHAVQSDGGANAGIFSSRTRQVGRKKDNSSAVGRFLQKKTGKLGGLVRHEGGKVNQFIRRRGRHGEDDDTDGDEYPDGYGDERVERIGSKNAGLGVDLIDETPEISQSDSDAIYAAESGNEMNSRGKRVGEAGGLGRPTLRERPLPTFRHTRRESSDTISPESPQTKLYNDNLPSFRSAAAAAATTTFDRGRSHKDDEDESQRSSQKTGRLAPPLPSSSNRLDLSKTTTADSGRSGGSRYLSQADSATAATRDVSRDSRVSTGDLSRSATRDSSARLNAILAVPGSIGSGGVKPMTGLANVKASNSFRDEKSRDNSRARSRSSGKKQKQNQSRPNRWSNCDAVAPDGTRSFSTAVAARALSRTEALLVCSGVKAKEVVRRAYEVQDPPSAFLVRVAAELGRQQTGRDGAISRVSRKEEYVLAGNWLAEDLEVAMAKYKEKAQMGTEETGKNDEGSSSKTKDDGRMTTATFPSPDTKGKSTSSLYALRARIAALQAPSSHTSADQSISALPTPKNVTLTDLADRVRAASSAADAIISDLSVIRRIPVRSLTDEVESLMRARRRRLRWVRRIVFVLLEWMLLGAMWSVWSIVMAVRIVWGTGRAVISGVRWFFWL